jgi:glutaredoxin 3
MSAANITIYSTATCGFCKMLKGYLQDKGISYNEKHADQDPKIAQELYDKSGQLGVPFTIIEKDGKEEMVLGFDREKINKVLEIS